MKFGMVIINSATIDKLIQKIKYKYDFITDVITLECQGKIGAD